MSRSASSLTTRTTSSVLVGKTTAPGVERAWFYETPPPLPNQRAVPEEWRELVRDVEKSGITDGTRRADMFKAWNAKFVGDPCRHTYLCGAPGHLFVYDPPRDADEADEKRPPYRFLPDATTPIRLTTNAYGFRGAPVPFQHQPRTVRIAFIGASTTVSSHYFPYSYPEFIGNWLNLWATQRKLDLKFEVLNAGRESITSTDNVNIVREEVLPLKPDFVLLQLYINDFETTQMRRPRPHPLISDSAARGWGHSSVLYDMVNSHWVQIQEATGLAESYVQYLARNLRDPNAPNAQLAFGMLRQFIARAKAAGVPCGLVLFPMTDAMGPNGSGYPVGFMHDRVRAIGADAHVPCLDLLPAFSSYKDPKTLWVSPFDAHPNAIANRRAAMEMLRAFGGSWQAH